ncbi:hypothetical protein [Gynuella sunshinyii]|uniref:Amidophosphoribosyltransferase n=1 Tax=Gynuella sunshinyii YC6258 TaxID=1445510 RepID=A0A0C5VDM7_9GAMM|nr:hypothetical protein [Gynuella sunshinyii]AJQ92296.1 hypothetical Protein YC6258_00244 [Gynuella sunshinyii YC6258]
MYDKFTQVDDSIRGDHYYLAPEDYCVFFGEYTARLGYSHSKTNQLIVNLKWGMEFKGTSRFRYKDKAIKTVANCLRLIANPENLTFVPIPPSKASDDPLYDDRLVQILEAFCKIMPLAHFSEILKQKASTRSSHECADGNRLKPDELEANYEIDNSKFDEVRENIVIFDDMLTTGSHFKAAQSVLHRVLPDRKIAGLFIARRVPESIDPLDILEDFLE